MSYNAKKEVSDFEKSISLPENPTEAKTVKDLLDLLETVAGATHIGKSLIMGNQELESIQKQHIQELEHIIEDVLKINGCSYTRKYS